MGVLESMGFWLMQTIKPSSKVSRFSEWLSGEIRLRNLATSLAAGLLIYTLEIIVITSFAALIYSGDLSEFMGQGIGLIIVGDALICAVVAIFSSYSGSIAIGQDAPSAVLAVAAASIAASFPANTGQSEQFMTVAAMILVTTLVTGLVFLFLGIFKLGKLVRYLPYPVMGGFLAGTGWLLFIGGIGVMAGQIEISVLFLTDILIRWIPGLILGAVLLYSANRFTSSLVMPLVLSGYVGLFYLTTWLAGIPITNLQSEGWLLGSFPSDGLWRFPLSADVITMVDWTAISALTLNLFPIVVVSVIALLLNANGLELIVNKDLDLDQELKVTGFANVAAGLFGGIVGYHAVSLSSLNHKLTGGRRLPGIFAALLLTLTVFLGGSVLPYLPKAMLGGLLVFLGLSMLIEWVYHGWFKFPKIDFAIILTILVIIAARGFLMGVAVGLVMTIILFVISYSQVNVVKYILSGKSYRSRVNRTYKEWEVLSRRGEQMIILKLQGFIFFGTANSLFERVQMIFQEEYTFPPKYFILDFEQVSGMDSTGLLSFSKMQKLAGDKSSEILLTSLSPRLNEQFTKGGFVDKPGSLTVFSDLDRAVEWCENEILAASALNIGKAETLYEQLSHVIPGSAALQRLIGYFDVLSVEPGQVIIRQGDDPDLIYFIESGQVTAQLESPDREPVRLETMQGGRAVGEIGFYLGSKRTAAVVVDVSSIIYSLSKDSLDEIEKNDPEAASAFHQVIVHLLGERVVHLMNVVNALQR